MKQFYLALSIVLSLHLGHSNPQLTKADTPFIFNIENKKINKQILVSDLVALSCGDSICATEETYCNCSQDCDCMGGIGLFVTNYTTGSPVATTTPVVYCKSDVTNGSTNPIPEEIYIPFAPNGQQACVTNWEITTDFGTLFGTYPLSDLTTGLLRLTDEDLNASNGIITLTYTDATTGGGCTFSSIIDMSIALDANGNSWAGTAATACSALCSSPSVEFVAYDCINSAATFDVIDVGIPTSGSNGFTAQLEAADGTIVSSGIPLPVGMISIPIPDATESYNVVFTDSISESCDFVYPLSDICTACPDNTAPPCFDCGNNVCAYAETYCNCVLDCECTGTSALFIMNANATPVSSAIPVVYCTSELITGVVNPIPEIVYIPFAPSGQQPCVSTWAVSTDFGTLPGSDTLNDFTIGRVGLTDADIVASNGLITLTFTDASTSGGCTFTSIIDMSTAINVTGNPWAGTAAMACPGLCSPPSLEFVAYDCANSAVIFDVIDPGMPSSGSNGFTAQLETADSSIVSSGIPLAQGMFTIPLPDGTENYTVVFTDGVSENCDLLYPLSDICTACPENTNPPCFDCGNNVCAYAESYCNCAQDCDCTGTSALFVTDLNTASPVGSTVPVVYCTSEIANGVIDPFPEIIYIPFAPNGQQPCVTAWNVTTDHGTLYLEGPLGDLSIGLLGLTDEDLNTSNGLITLTFSDATTAGGCTFTSTIDMSTAVDSNENPWAGTAMEACPGVCIPPTLTFVSYNCSTSAATFDFTDVGMPSAGSNGFTAQIQAVDGTVLSSGIPISVGIIVIQLPDNQAYNIVFTDGVSAECNVISNTADICTSTCPENITLSISETGNVAYQVSNTITSADVIENGENVIYDVGQVIHLDQGFTVVGGANFSAIIGGCVSLLAPNDELLKRTTNKNKEMKRASQKISIMKN